MAKKKEQAITVTYTEILGFAIQRIADLAVKEEENAKQIENTNPALAQDIRAGSL